MMRWIGFCLVLAATAARAQISGTAPVELTLVTLAGDRQILATLPPTVFAPRFSPDGASIAYDSVDFETGAASITLADIEEFGDGETLPHFASEMNWAPVFSPDGERVVFLATTPEGDRIWSQNADGSGNGRHLVDGRSAESWTGPNALTYLTLAGNEDYGIAMLDLGTGESRPFLDLPGSAEHSSNVSRDGRYVAYVSNASGRFEVFVEPLPQTGVRVRVTTEGGGHPVWSPDGRTLYFDRDGRMHRIGFDPAADRATGAAEPLPIAGFVQGIYRRQFDLAPDGGRFVMLFPAGD